MIPKPFTTYCMGPSVSFISYVLQNPIISYIIGRNHNSLTGKGVRTADTL